ncbi:hypothetical protein [Sediminicoccus sp. KRV36]|uniref:hypothetical protein n=1 Tax=Sediminicoccus sp. KRV36 TaxID=3133721 RepID=UPI00200E3FCD|nr:hypothetical protein [Sediminicoccus rosea]UPY37024.1 hypothetical protein LHU95_22875 [Sediminicoccus rosea]
MGRPAWCCILTACGVVQMNLKTLLGMRPKTESVADIEAALAAARGAGEAAARAEAELLAKRGGVLLSGTPEEVTRAEEALARARTEAEHAATMVPILEAKLADAMRGVQLNALRAKLAEAGAKADAARVALGEQYPKLAAALVHKVLIPEREALAAIEDARVALDAALRAGLIQWDDGAPVPAEWVLPPAPLAELAPMVPGGVRRPALGVEVRLPALTGQGWPADPATPIWPGAGA